MKISCIVLNHNLPDDTVNLMANLKNQTVKPEIIVVDNGSSKECLEKIKTAQSDVRIIERDFNDGVAGGYNAGIKDALKNKSDYIAVLNNDLIIEQKDYLEQMIKEAQKDNQVGIAGPLIYFARGYEYQKAQEGKGKVIWYAGGITDWKNVYHSHRGVDEVDNGQYNKVEETDFITGAFMLFKREVFEKIGLFNEKYALYKEDVEICERAKRAGYKLLFVPQAKIYHKVSQTVGNAIGMGMNDYYLTRNRLMFGLTYAPVITKFALLRESVKLLFTGREKQKEGVKDFFLGRLGKRT